MESNQTGETKKEEISKPKEEKKEDKDKKEPPRKEKKMNLKLYMYYLQRRNVKKNLIKN